MDGDSPPLKEVFSGGQPWLVWCQDSTDGDDVSAVHSVVDQAAPLLMGVAKTGILDCSEEFPNGKTTYSKLGLEKTSPTLFFVANGAKPRQLSPKHVKSAQSIVQYVNKHGESTALSPLPLIFSHKYEKSLCGAASPVMRRPTSQEDLQSDCLGRRWCAVVLTDGRLSGAHKSDAQELMHAHRAVQFNAVDSSKYRISTEPKVLRKGEPSNDEPSMLMFYRMKNEHGKAVTLARVHRGDLTAGGGAGDALEESMDLKSNGRPGGKGWVTLSGTPKIFYKKGGEPRSGFSAAALRVVV